MTIDRRDRPSRCNGSRTTCFAILFKLDKTASSRWRLPKRSEPPADAIQQASFKDDLDRSIHAQSRSPITDQLHLTIELRADLITVPGSCIASQFISPRREGAIQVKISVACNCGKTLSADQSLAGKRGQCPACGSLLTIPAAAHPAEGAVSQQPRPQPTLPPSGTRQTGLLPVSTSDSEPDPSDYTIDPTSIALVSSIGIGFLPGSLLGLIAPLLVIQFATGALPSDFWFAVSIFLGLALGTGCTYALYFRFGDTFRSWAPRKPSGLRRKFAAASVDANVADAASPVADAVAMQPFRGLAAAQFSTAVPGEIVLWQGGTQLGAGFFPSLGGCLFSIFFGFVGLAGGQLEIRGTGIEVPWWTPWPIAILSSIFVVTRFWQYLTTRVYVTNLRLRHEFTGGAEEVLFSDASSVSVTTNEHVTTLVVVGKRPGTQIEIPWIDLAVAREVKAIVNSLKMADTPNSQ